jgi:hypothetical protein
MSRERIRDSHPRALAPAEASRNGHGMRTDLDGPLWEGEQWILRY